MSRGLSFRVYGLEFCRMLEAVAMFQALPRETESYAAVRCIVSADGLSLLALNLRSAAAGHVELAEQDGVGVFSIPAAQVKAVLAIFRRKLPKEVSADEYVLEVTLSPLALRIADVSVLFDGDEFQMSVPDGELLERGQESDADRVMRTAGMVASLVEADLPLDLRRGVSWSPAELVRLGRAAKVLEGPLFFRAVGKHLLATVGGETADFVALTTASTPGPDAKGPFEDQITIDHWRQRLHVLVDEAVLS